MLLEQFFIPIFFLFLNSSNSYGASVNSNNIIESRQIFNPRNILTNLATNLMTRGFGTSETGSQVVSLNVTNLLILVLLKALIFAAASVTGHKNHDYFARNIDNEDNEENENKFLTDEEVLLYLTYLTGAPGNNGCLQNIGCHQPQEAKKYVKAGDVLLKTAQMLSYYNKNDDSYEYILKELDYAANVGLAGGNCGMFQCEEITQKNNTNV